jgi:2,5-furandicarboxylate decarboxylase 1
MYIQIRKTADSQPRMAILAALAAAGGSVKHVFVFDEDVDIFDEQDVLWAIGSRSDWAKDMIVVPNSPTTDLDPTATGHRLGTSAGLDCTKPAAPTLYEQRSFVPPEVMAEVRLEDYIPNAPRQTPSRRAGSLISTAGA